MKDESYKEALQESSDYITECVDRFEKRKEQYERTKEAASVAYSDMEEAELALAEALGALPGATVEVRGVRYTKDSKMYFRKAVAEDIFFKALAEHDLGDIVKKTVHANTLNGALREVISRNDGEIPDWMKAVVSIYDKAKVSRRVK